VIETDARRRTPRPAQSQAGLYRDTLIRFEEGLGDPRGEGPLSYAAAAARDRDERYPHEAIDHLARLGAHRLQIPAAEDGALQSLEQLIAGSYAIGRRDAAVSLSGGLQMWSQLVWMAGSEAQRRALRALVNENHGVCLAASEPDHGADLLSTACRAAEAGSSYVLHGEKWPIGCASTCRAALVLARTRPERGPRSLSWFFLGPDALDRPECRRLPKVPTVGMRASDVSGFAFDGLTIDRDSLVGAEGAGLELAIKLFQLTRPLVASLALGPGDTALRIAAEFAAARRLYGRTAAELTGVRRALVRAWVDFTIAEIVAVTTARGAHVDPKGLTAGSLVAKIVVPSLVHTAVDHAARVLGARALMRDHALGTFEKMLRDQRVVSVLDGSTEVCVQSLATQLPVLLRRSTPARDWTQLARQCRAGDPVEAIDYGQLEVAPREPGLVVSALRALVSAVDPPAPSGDVAWTIAAHVDDDGARLAERVARWLSGEQGAARDAALADAASDYAMLHALGACAAFGVCNRGRGLVTDRSSWLWMVARRLSAQPLSGAPPEHELVDDLYPDLSRRVAGGDLLSAVLPVNGDDD
jgi:alkylation response protein AidB-like acyl-CoA dehydrogenase